MCLRPTSRDRDPSACAVDTADLCRNPSHLVAAVSIHRRQLFSETQCKHFLLYMSTRSGRNYKVGSEMANEGIENLMTVLIEDRKSREAQYEDERDSCKHWRL